MSMGTPYFIQSGREEGFILERVRKYDWNRFKNAARFYLLFALIVIFIILWAFGVIQIYITVDAESANLVWTVINSLLLYMYFTCLGFSRGISKISWKMLVLVVLIVVIISGLGYLGLDIVFNLPIFIWKTYSTNTISGAYFFTLNAGLWTVVFFLSFTIEGENKNAK